MLAQANEGLNHKYPLKAAGIDIDYVAGKVANLFSMPVEDLWREGRYKQLVHRSQLWEVVETSSAKSLLLKPTFVLNRRIEPIICQQEP